MSEGRPAYPALATGAPVVGGASSCLVLPMFSAMQIVGGLTVSAIIRFIDPQTFRSSMMTDPNERRPEVLFVCVHNAGRSQMAAALLAHHGGDRVIVRSAGTAPVETINPAVVEAMAELGIDLMADGARPKRLEDAAVKASDVVITMGCGDACPLLPGKRYESWELADPAGQDLDDVRPIRDEIRRRVDLLLASLGVDRA